MSTLKQRFLLVSDMHYTTEETPEEMKQLHPEAKTSLAAGNAFGKTQREKIEKIYEDIIEEHRRSPLDAVFVLGDLSIDDYDYRCLPDNYCRKFKEACMDRLPVPSYALPGNHDSYPNGMWREIFGYDREYAIELGDCVFLMADTFANTPASKTNPAGGAPINPIHDDFLQACLAKYKGKRIFLCAHHLDGERITEEGKRLIRESGDVVFLYHGHTHVNGVIEMGEAFGDVRLCDIGGYGYSGQLIDGRYTFHLFDFQWAWGYQIIEVYDDVIKTYHVKTANTYVADNGVFSVEETVEGACEYRL